MLVHEFVCGDCETDVFGFGGDPDAKLCQSCVTIREMKEREPMTPEAEKALREILGCVISARRTDKPGVLELDISPDEP
jgi:hypothetical protein